MKSNFGFSLMLLLLFSFQSFSQEWIEKTNVIPTKDLADGDLFGASMQVYDDILVVGALLSDEFGLEAGGAYVFQRVEDAWVKIATLEPSLKMDKMQFGATVAIYGDLIAVGAPQYRGDGQSFSGIVFLYEKVGGNWSDGIETCVLQMSEPSIGGRFGRSLSIHQDEVLVGSTSIAHIFKKPASGWENMVETAKLIIPTGTYLGGSSSSLLLANNFAIIGSPDYTVDGAPIGATYYFKKPDNGWETTDISTAILSTLPGRSMEFGHAVAVNDFELFISSGHDSPAGRTNDYIHIYDLPKKESVEISFVPKAILETVNTGAFGRISSIAASHDKVFVGSANGLDNGISSGLSLVFTKPSQGWQDSNISEKIFNGNPHLDGAFGSKILIRGTNILISDPMKSNGGGHGIIYTLNQDSEFLGANDILESQAQNATADEFGSAISISGKYAAVGSFRDDEVAYNAGAVYIYRRMESGWELETKILPFDGQSSGNFGYSVSIYGNTLVVGSPGNDEGKSSSGAAYIYERSLTGWSSDNATKFVEPIAKQGGAFGRSVDIHKGKIIVTALYTGDSHSMGTGYIIEKIEGTYSISAELTTMQDPTGARWFGRLASIYENEVVIGSRFGMFAFQANDTWHNMTETATLPSPQTSIFTDFTDIDIAPGVAFFGHPRPALRWPNFEAGKVFVHENVDHEWSNSNVTATLLGPANSLYEKFGSAVSASEQYVAVGNYMDSTSNQQRGKTYLFKKPATGWSGETVHESELLPAMSSPGAEFGYDVSMYGHTLVVGAPNNDTESGFKSGSAFFYELDAPFITGVRSLESGPFKEGDIFQIAVDFSEAIEVTGEPYLLLEFDDHKIDTAFFSRAESQTIVLDYEAKIEFKSNHLDYRNENAFAGLFTITRSDAVEAITVLPPVGTEESLAEQNIAFDFVAPELLESDIPAFFSDETREVKLTFSEEVLGLAEEDFVFSNSSFVELTGSASVYYLKFTPTDEGEIQIDLPIGSVQDPAGNQNQNVYSITAVYDNTQPALLEDPILPEITNTSFQVSLAFNEDIINFTAEDVVLTNATIENFSSKASVVVFDIVPIDDGKIIIEIEAASFTDKAGNANNPLAFYSKADVRPPRLLLQQEYTAFTNETVLSIAFEPSEKIKDFSVEDLLFTNCSYSSFEVNENIYSLLVMASAEGEFSIETIGSSFTDSIGNFNEPLQLFESYYDVSAPEWVIPSERDEYANGPFTLNLKFNEKVVGLELEDISVQNGEVIDINGQDSSYQVLIEPMIDGEVTVSIPNESVLDLAGNYNISPFDYSLIFDSTLPELNFDLVEKNNEDKSLKIDLIFSEEVVEFTSDQLTLENLSIVNEEWIENTLRLSFQPIEDGITSISLPEKSFFDVAANSNTEPYHYSYLFDSKYPTVAIQPDSLKHTNSAFLISFNFSEPVKGFDISDILLTNGSKSDFTMLDNSLYTFKLTPLTEGNVKVSIEQNAFSDIAGNNNTKKFQSQSIQFDKTSPIVGISGDGRQFVNGPFPVFFQFTEPVIGFDSTDISLVNGKVSNFTKFENNKFGVTILPKIEGEIIIELASNILTDMALNPNLPAKAPTFYFDSTGPLVQFISNASDYINEPFTLSFQTNEHVLNFDVSDIDVENAILSLISRSDSSITTKITPLLDGEVRLSIDSAKFDDLAHNHNQSTISRVFHYDRIKPQSLTQFKKIPGLEKSMSIKIGFSEPIEIDLETALEWGNLSIVSQILEGDTAYIVATTPEDGTVNVTLKAGSFYDRAGNRNSEKITTSFNYDSTPPTIDIISKNGNYFNSSFEVTLSVNEPVEGFQFSDITISNGQVSMSQIDSSNYLLEIQPALEGDIIVDISDSVFTDLSQNYNVGLSTIFHYDTTPPVAEIEITREGTLARHVKVNFSEDIVGLNIDAIHTENLSVDSLLKLAEPYAYQIFYSFLTNNESGFLSIVQNKVFDFAKNELIAPGEIAVSALSSLSDFNNAIKVFPNPAKHYLIVELSNKSQIGLPADLISMTGEILKVFRLDALITEIDLTGINQQAFLILRVYQKNGVQFEKVLLDSN